MIEVKQLYVVFDDGDGHRYLIPKCEYRHLDKDFDNLGENE